MPALSGERIGVQGGTLSVPDRPIIPFIEGDGTGPDIWRASQMVFDAAVQKAYGGKKKVAWAEVLAGEKAYRAVNNWLPPETVDAFRTYLVGIKGPLTTPVGGGIRSLNVALRQQLDLYVCLRPVRYFRGVPSPVRAPEKVDMVIFRENTEDIYAGIEFEIGERAQSLLSWLKQAHPKEFAKVRFPNTSGIGIKPVSREGSERLVRAAINYALTHKRKSVTLVHKGNIMKYTEGAFRNWGYELAAREFGPKVYSWEQWEATKSKQGEEAANAEQKQALSSGRLLIKDAIGNINYVSGHAVFEATHGTAPKYANQDKVNPGSVILSGEMMFRYLGWSEAADLILRGIEKTIASKKVTYDFARLMKQEGQSGVAEVKTSEFGQEIVRNM